MQNSNENPSLRFTDIQETSEKKITALEYRQGESI